MTIPTQHNCPHSPDGWCLGCVGELAREIDRLKAGQFTVELWRRIGIHGKCQVTLSKRIILPFVPTPAILLGLEEGSDFSRDVLQVERVMWQASHEMFLVELHEFRVGDAENSPRTIERMRRWYLEFLRRLMDDGWRVRLCIPDACDTPDDADDYDPGQDPVILWNGKYYSADRSEIEALTIQGEQFIIVKEGVDKP